MLRSISYWWLEKTFSSGKRFSQDVKTRTFTIELKGQILMDAKDTQMQTPRAFRVWWVYWLLAAFISPLAASFIQLPAITTKEVYNLLPKEWIIRVGGASRLIPILRGAEHCALALLVFLAFLFMISVWGWKHQDSSIHCQIVRVTRTIYGFRAAILPPRNKFWLATGARMTPRGLIIVVQDKCEVSRHIELLLDPAEMSIIQDFRTVEEICVQAAATVKVPENPGAKTHDQKVKEISSTKHRVARRPDPGDEMRDKIEPKK